MGVVVKIGAREGEGVGFVSIEIMLNGLNFLIKWEARVIF